MRPWRRWAEFPFATTSVQANVSGFLSCWNLRCGAELSGDVFFEHEAFGYAAGAMVEFGIDRGLRW